MPSRQACHQSSGRCSDQPGRGKDRGYSRVAVRTISPDRLTSSSFTAEVPRSMPMVYIYALPFHVFKASIAI